MDIRKTQVLAYGLDLVVGFLFALVSALALHLVLFMPFWTGLLVGLLFYAVFRVLGRLGERGGVDL